MSINDLSDTIVPKSDQLNADALLAGPITVTVTNVSRDDADQPLVLNFEGDRGKPYKPCKSMRKVLVFAWGADGSQWIGRSMTLFNDPEVMFGGVKVGGIRISHLSHIDKELQLSLTATKGKKKPFIIQKLAVKKAAPEAPEMTKEECLAFLNGAALKGMDALVAAFKSLPAAARKQHFADGCPQNLKDAAALADNPPAAEPAPADDDQLDI